MSGAYEPRSSIRRRLLIFLLPSLTLLMLTSALLEYRAALLFTRRTFDQRLIDASGLIAGRLLQEPLAAACPASQALTGNSAPLYCSVTTERGQRIAGASLRAAEAVIPARSSMPTVVDGWAGDSPVRIASLRLETASGARIVQVAASSGGYREPLRLILGSTWLIGIVQLDLTLLLVWLGVRYGLKPLVRLRTQIESRSPRDLSPLTHDGVPGEVRPLMDSLNLLLAMLGEAARSQRTFLADTAHQLRTPLAGLIGNLETLLRDPKAASFRERLSTLHSELTALAHSANQLLVLARAEPTASLDHPFKPVELGELVARVVERHIDQSVARGLDLGAEAQPACVDGQARLLDDLLSNLLDNALQYTPAGGTVTVRCGLSEGAPYLEVEDNGPGIPEHERTRVRERFYRIPGTSGAGCGLGLAIVDEIAALHHAAFRIDAGQGGRGTRMQVRFPAPSP